MRLDLLLVERGLAPSRERARALILAGRVTTGDRRLDKAGELVLRDVVLQVEADHPYVSRGGVKLAGALERLAVDPSGLVCLDIGASTGGFTDCLLRHGAERVYAVDVGYGQLAWSLRQDPRVVVLERTNARHLKELPEQAALCVVDASFISLRLLLEPIARLTARGGRLLALVKPQFEVGRGRVGKGGVVRDDALRQESVEDVVAAAGALGFLLLGQSDCVIAGPKGNREIFILLQLGDPPAEPAHPSAPVGDVAPE